jgi:hypothetical protein
VNQPKSHHISIEIREIETGQVEFLCSFGMRVCGLCTENLEQLATILAQYHYRVQQIVALRRDSMPPR